MDFFGSQKLKPKCVSDVWKFNEIKISLSDN